MNLRSTVTAGGMRPLPRAELATAFYQLSRFLSVGVPLVDTLEDVSASAVGRAGRQVWTRVTHLVESGHSLSEALVGIHVESTVLAIIRSGEASGQLDSACQVVSEYLHWHIELRRRMVTLLVYPLFSLCVLVVVTGFLFISVVPSIEGFLLSTGNALEWHTLALLGFSAWISEYFFIVASVTASIAISMVFLVAISPVIRFSFDKCLLTLPLIGPVLTDLLLSRYARCCAQLYRQGIALETSLQLAEETVGNYALRAELARVRLRMVSGISLSDALLPVSVLPTMFTRLVAVGERSGQLSSVLVQLAEQQRITVEASINRMEQMTGPLLMLCIGSVLLWIVVSMLGPVYNMAIVTVTGAS